MAEQENIQTVQDAYAAFQRGEIQKVLNTLAEDVEWITPGPPEVLPTAGHRRGRQQVAQFFNLLDEAEEIEQFEPHEFIAQGDKVVALVKYRSRVKTTGRTAESDLAHIFTFRGGKVARFQEFFDTAAAVEAFRGSSPRSATAT